MLCIYDCYFSEVGRMNDNKGNKNKYLLFSYIQNALGFIGKIEKNLFDLYRNIFSWKFQNVALKN